MSERLLEIAIYGLSGLIVILLGWVFFREYLFKFRRDSKQQQMDEIRALFLAWLSKPKKQKTKIQKKLSVVADPALLQEYFFETFNDVSEKEREKLIQLFDVLGIQNELRGWLKESSDVLKREEAVLKLAKVGAFEDVPFLLDAFHDPEEVDRVKQCCVKAITEMADPLIHKEHAVANLALYVKLLDIPNHELRKKIADLLCKLPIKMEDIIPLLIQLETDSAKEGVLEVFESWNKSEYAQILYDYLDDLNPTIRRNAVQILGKFKDEQAQLLLIKKLKDPDEQVRSVTIEVLSGFNNTAIHDHLFKVLSDPDVHNQVKAYLYFCKHYAEKHFALLVSKLTESEFQKAFMVAMHDKSSQSKDEVDKIFFALGMDHRIFISKFGWAATDKFHDLYIETAKHSLEAALRKKAIKALLYWERKEITSVLEEISTKDPDEKNRAYAKSRLIDFKKKKGGRK